MRSIIFAVALSLPLPVFAAGPIEVKAGDHSCGELAQIIRQNKKVFVRIGFGGRSFRYPPAQCSMGEKRTTTSFRDAEGKQCILDYACVFDPASPYNFP
ncbi:MULTISPECIES: hypothetical protein [Rhizobium]|uniref:Uncharacterized protein n=1 Tax=Rhizobium changzhiense TaxID=2692317 RepID=A0A7Z0U8I3_9HYPH|nr:MULTISPECIES: hypothetical protein [Rhizobium]MBA5802889.1 hypothetical protein [Rhizobium changzhiense]MCH4545835.1 hypothetical protein [Rhizobium changzhiense]MCV9941994.1 hypothetical protein [Rhizobium sp. BT-175]MCW0016044.1 hypothetical protein [Rhizobium sp. BT-226]NNU49455.1 hypothetical protein [Rhizobium changzhiense]